MQKGKMVPRAEIQAQLGSRKGPKREFASFHDGPERPGVAKSPARPPDASTRRKAPSRRDKSLDDQDDELLEPVDGRYVDKAIDGRYEVKRLLGSGGMGEVYLAYDTSDKKDVAIKIAFKSHGERAARRLLRELEVLGMVQHERIVGCTDSGEVDGRRYMVMEYVKGEDLITFIRRHGGLGLDKALRITGQLAEALEALAEKGIVHRDLKPENVIVESDAGGPSVKIIDFGLAVIEGGERIESKGNAAGTPAYMSPEQARGLDVTPTSDIYALASNLFEMVTGQPLFTGFDPEYVMRGVRDYIPGLHALITDDLPRGVNRLITKMHATDPSKRPTSREVKAQVAAMIEEISGPKASPSA